MSEVVELRTDRLVLRRLRQEDIAQLLPLIGAREIAATTLRIPHPYTLQHALDFLKSSDSAWEKGEAARFGVFLRERGRLCGDVSLSVNLEHNHAELGYWIGVPYWGNGYCTEAARRVLEYGFNTLQLHRIHAGHYSSNPASGRVLRKLGLEYEGTRKQHVCKWGEYLDVEIYGVLSSEYRSQGAGR